MNILYSPDFYVILSDIYTDLNINQTISDTSITNYKNFILETREFANNMNYAAGYLVYLAMKYLMSVRTSSEDNEFISNKFDNIVQSINDIIPMEDNVFIRQYFAATLSNLDDLKTVDAKIASLNSCTGKDDIKDVFLALQFNMVLARLYMFDTDKYRQEIINVSSQIKSLVPLKNAKEAEIELKISYEL